MFNRKENISIQTEFENRCLRGNRRNNKGCCNNKNLKPLDGRGKGIGRGFGKINGVCRKEVKN